MARNLTFAIAVCGVLAARPGAADERVSFNNDIQPILSDTCFACHGPDSDSRESELRFDTQGGAFIDLGDGRKSIVPGKPEQSEVFLRITSDDPEVKMPPAGFERQLTPAQIEKIRLWIAQGAPWQEHWAFVTPVRPPLPSVGLQPWPRNGIDRFILSRLEREGLTASPAATKETLVRRVTLDLTGLPPTLAETDAFLADDSPQAYERVVDRLLRSPRFGERMAMVWLDAARYADTSGYQNDGPRDMWRWRDWVIDAYNRNLPFDQFTIEQLAGDLLPNPTLEQRVATGFNRNHRGNAEGGIIPEEFAVEYVVDRVETTFTVWLGMTMGCVRCHDHKYDPVKQREFYEVFAYFNNVPEHGRAIKEGNSPPYIKAPTPAQQKQLTKLDKRLERAIERVRSLDKELAASQSAWEKTVDRSSLPAYWSISDGLAAHQALDGDLTAPARFVDGEPDFAAGRIGRAGVFDGSRFVEVGDVANFGYFDRFSFGAWVKTGGKETGTIVSRMTNAARGDGYYLHLQDGRVQVNLVKRWLDDSIRVESRDPLPAGEWHHLMAVYDGSRKAAGITLYVDGKPWPLVVKLDALNQSFASDQPLRIGAGSSLFTGTIDDVRVYDRDLSPEDVEIVAVSGSPAAILAVSNSQRTPSETRKLRAFFLQNHAPQAVRNAHQILVKTRRERRAFYESIPTVMVMEELDTPRETFVLTRGEYNKPAERVGPGVPDCLTPLPADAPNNRLGFARWLVDPQHPLTARVAVNRYWQMLFGTGLVKTVEDFGSQGERPSHPELLDWLAREFADGGWNVRAILRTIVTSATYRQSSRVTPSLMERDPDNRLLARGPRFRLRAELIRDQALAIAGLLNDRRGGPSVKPYQPAGLWQEIATVTDYDQSHGSALYRRSMYTYWKRTVAPPSMMVFDATSREACKVRQTRTNTPLQALTLMNDVGFVEAARVFAERMMSQGGPDDSSRIIYGFRLATSRSPRPDELRVLLRGLERYRKHYAANEQAANALLKSGEAARDRELKASELAAYTMIGSLLLNLDEVVTKG